MADKTTTTEKATAADKAAAADKMASGRLVATVSGEVVCGRPTKLTPEIAKTILAKIQEGHFRSTAARIAGCSPRQVKQWMKEGQKRPDSLYGDFRTLVLVSESASEMNLLDIVKRAAKLDPRHAQWILARRFPSRWGRQREMGPPTTNQPSMVAVVQQGIVASTNGHVGQDGQQRRPVNRIAGIHPAELATPSMNGNGHAELA